MEELGEQSHFESYAHHQRAQGNFFQRCPRSHTCKKMKNQKLNSQLLILSFFFFFFFSIAPTFGIAMRVLSSKRNTSYFWGKKYACLGKIYSQTGAYFFQHGLEKIEVDFLGSCVLSPAHVRFVFAPLKITRKRQAKK